MLRYFFEPTYGDAEAFGASSSPTIPASTKLGNKITTNIEATAENFCEIQGFGLVKAVISNANDTIAYHDDSTGLYETKPNSSWYLQITCDDCTATSTVQVVPASTTVFYDGANFHEWLFVAGVFLFFIAFMSWGRISFTRST